MGQGNQTREKKPAWDPLKDYDERAKAYQAERKVQSKYNREQGADLPKSLVEQVQNRDKIEHAKGGQYETSVRKGPRQGWDTVTKDIPFEGPYCIMQTEINNLKFAAEHATNDQITRAARAIDSKADLSVSGGDVNTIVWENGYAGINIDTLKTGKGRGETIDIKDPKFMDKLFKQMKKELNFYLMN